MKIQLERVKIKQEFLYRVPIVSENGFIWDDQTILDITNEFQPIKIPYYLFQSNKEQKPKNIVLNKIKTRIITKHTNKKKNFFIEHSKERTVTAVPNLNKTTIIYVMTTPINLQHSVSTTIITLPCEIIACYEILRRGTV